MTSRNTKSGHEAQKMGDCTRRRDQSKKRRDVLDINNLKQNEAQRARAESTRNGVTLCAIYVTLVQQQRPESPTVTLTWHARKYKVHKLHQSCIRVNTRYINSRGGVYVPCILHACQVRVTVGDSGLCCCTCVTYLEL